MDRYFYTDSDGNPNIFEFSVESVGVMKPHKIIFKRTNKIFLKNKKIQY